MTIELTGYRADDMPACLAAAGIVRALTRYADCPVRLSWGQMHPTLYLPEGTTPGSIAKMLHDTAATRANSPHWTLLDTCDDAASWDAATKVVAQADPRDGGDILTAAASYVGGKGGRSPLICVARNMTPGRWAKKCIAATMDTNWLAHFNRWSESGGSWQGWRDSGEGRGCDPAAVWLAFEGLAYYPCSQTPAWERPRPEHLDVLSDIEGVGMAPPYKPATRKDVLCPGWDYARKTWRFPLWDSPIGMDPLRSLVASSERIRYAVFNRRAKRMGNYYLPEFGPGIVTRPATRKCRARGF